MAAVTLTVAKPRNTQFIYDLYCKDQILKGHGLHKAIPAPYWKSVIEGTLPGFENVFLVTQGAAFLGHVGFQNLSKDDRHAEIAIAIIPDMQGKGIATGAMKCVVDLAKKSQDQGGLGLDTLYAWVIEDNTPSARLFQRYGFVHSGTIPMYFRYGSKRLSRMLYIKSL